MSAGNVSLACMSYHWKSPYSYKQNSSTLVVNQFKCFIVPLSFNLSLEKSLRNIRGMKIPTSEYNTKVNEDCKVLMSWIADLENKLRSRSWRSSKDGSSTIKAIYQNILMIQCIKYLKYCYSFISPWAKSCCYFHNKASKKCIYLNGNSRIIAFSWGNEKNAETHMLVMHMDVNLVVKVIHFPMFFVALWYLVNIIQALVALEKCGQNY